MILVERSMFWPNERTKVSASVNPSFSIPRHFLVILAAGWPWNWNRNVNIFHGLRYFVFLACYEAAIQVLL